MKTVELVSRVPLGVPSGIGRYVNEIYQGLNNQIPIRLSNFRYLPGAKYQGFFSNFPIGILEHKPGSIIHLTQIMGASMLLWRSYHPVIVTVHDLGFLEWPPEARMYSPLERFFIRMSMSGLKKADHLIAVSDFTRQGLIQHLKISPEKVTTIYSGIDHKLFHPIPDARKLLIKKYPQLMNNTGPWLLYVGNEFPRKNLGVLFKAGGLLREIYPDILIIKVGHSGGERFRSTVLGQIQQAKMEDKVVFLDKVPDKDLPVIYSAADVYVHPSFLEGFGFPVLEAMSCGTPVVCLNSGSLPEIVRDAAQIVDINQHEEMTQGIERILNDKLLRNELVRKGLSQKSIFNWKSINRKYCEIYNSF